MELALASCRFVHFVATTALFGASFYTGVLSTPPLRHALTARFAPFALPLAGVALASEIMLFGLTAWSMSGDERFAPDAALDVLTGTGFGQVSVLRIVILVALTGVCALRWARGALVLSALTVATLGLTGHAVLQDGGFGWAHRANDALHVLLVSGWIGGLPPFLACLNLAQQPETRRGALAAMMRFSAIGHVATPLIFVTGAANVALTTGAFPWPLDSPYRGLLALKVGLFAAMVLIALANRYLWVPRIARAPYALVAIKAMTVAELLLSFGALALVSFFGMLDPK